MENIIHKVKHYWTDHKKAVIVIGVILVLAIIA